MEGSLTIAKRRTERGADSYEYLRRKGLEHIQNLGHRLWTDYNTHDPGVTIMEALCFALTDLSYRAQHPIEDLLEEPQLLAPGNTSSFFPARQVLSCSPVTLLDLRGLLIDVPGIRNAWLQPIVASEPEFYLDVEGSRLTWDQRYGVDLAKLQGLPEGTLPDRLKERVRGLAGRLYDEQGFKDALLAALSVEDEELFRDKLLSFASAYSPLRPEGGYRVLLEFEEDSKLGVLNRLMLLGETLDVDPIAFEVHWVNPWESFVQQGLQSNTPFLGAEIGPLQYDSAGELYRASLLLRLEGEAEVTVQLTVRHRRDKTTTNAARILTALRQLKGKLVALVFQKVEGALTFAEAALTQLHAHRNLAEDFYQVTTVETEELALCAEIEVERIASIEMVAAEIEERIGALIKPRPTFYTLAEMLDRGFDSDSLFSGPALRHGFLDYAELADSELKTELHVSDLIQIIMEIPGVVAVKELTVARWLRGEVLNSGEGWTLPLSGRRRLHLSSRLSRLRFFKDLVPFVADREVVKSERRRLGANQRHQRLAPEERDFEPVRGKARQVREFQSIQNHFPLTYGVGDEGLAPTASPSRKAEAKQLKAYLQIFDQLLADYLAQLASIPQLFSLEPALARSYFGQPLYTVPESYHLTVVRLEQCSRVNELPSPVQDALGPVLDGSQHDLQSVESHLSAALGTSSWQEHRELLLEAFLVAGLGASSTPRVESSEKRFVDSLLEPADWERSGSFAPEWEKYVAREKESWVNRSVQGDRLRESEEAFAARRNGFLDHLMARFGEQFSDYALLTYEMEQRKAPRILIQDKCTFLKEYPRISAARGQAMNQRGGAVETNVSGFEHRVCRLLGLEKYHRRRLAPSEHADAPQDAAASRGFHLVEHVLLRPRAVGERLMAVATAGTGDVCPGAKDPYSFRLSVLVPAWPKRFEQTDFRRFFESTLRREAPAHTHVRICWLNPDAMNHFEQAFFPWLQELARGSQQTPELSTAREALIVALCQARSVYPKSILGECSDVDDGASPVLLNNSVLGSPQGVEDE